jgi:hypothetical protein
MRYRDCENCGIEIDSREIVTRCTECKELINKPKTETMNNFKEKDKVFVYPYGFGIFEKYYGSDGCFVNCNNIP